MKNNRNSIVTITFILFSIHLPAIAVEQTHNPGIQKPGHVSTSSGISRPLGAAATATPSATVNPPLNSQYVGDANIQKPGHKQGSSDVKSGTK